MSERVTLTTCPSCGGLAAVGWTTVQPVGDETVAEAPVEFDCTCGCQLAPEEMQQVFDDSR